MAFSAIFQALQGQTNLVPNPSFEEFTDCPKDISHKLQAGDMIIPHWFTPSKGSPDYYNSCSKSYKSRTGKNWIGDLKPENGQGYVGLLVEDEVREYIQVKLNEPLKAGHIYELEMLIGRASNTTSATENIGLLFTHDKILKNSYDNLLAQPSFQLSDDLAGALVKGWQDYHGSYTATGGEQYLTIGNFSPSKEIEKVKGPAEYHYCYYFFDFISVSEKYDFSEQIDLQNSSYYANESKNLVWNGGFEYSNNCRLPLSTLPIEPNTEIAPFWRTLGSGTPDVFMHCEQSDQSTNRKTKEEASYTGKNMAGFIAYHEGGGHLGKNYSEYLLGSLKEPLQEGKDYYISYRLRASDFSRYAVENLGIKFFNEAPSKLNFDVLDERSDITYPLNHEISYKDGWIKLSGKFHAQGDEQCFAIGLFGAPNPKRYDEFQSGEFSIKERSEDLILPYAYYYLDNVTVSEDSSMSKTRFEDHPESNYVFLLDLGNTMAEDGKLDGAIKSMRELLLHLKPEDKVSLISLSGKVKVLVEEMSSKDFEKFDKVIDHINPKGNTKISDGFKSGTQLVLDLEIEDGNNHFVVLSDQVFDNKSCKEMMSVLDDHGINTHVLILGEEAPENNTCTNKLVHVHYLQNGIGTDQLIQILHEND
jgi:hypothetical protein